MEVKTTIDRIKESNSRIGIRNDFRQLVGIISTVEMVWARCKNGGVRDTAEWLAS
jgi:hypothetical protein